MLANLVEVDFSSLTGATSKNVVFAPVIFLLEHGKDVGQRLATARSQAGIVTENTTMRRKDGKELFEMVCLDAEIAEVGAGSKGNVNTVRLDVLLGLSAGALLDFPVSGTAEVTKQVDNAGERLGAGEQLLLKCGVLDDVLFGSDGKLSPVVEDLVGLGTGTTLELGLDGPGEGTLAILFEDDVDTLRVDVFGIEEEAVHVEQTGPDGRKTAREYLG
ncbi:hypothetical protein HG530_000756 [Fusarium avenaceum]|nr:hypothetical protein HG530_000756 [Fusarium avenaceum]